MTIPPIFYTVVSERDGSYDEPLCWEQQALRAPAPRLSATAPTLTPVTAASTSLSAASSLTP